MADATNDLLQKILANTAATAVAAQTAKPMRIERYTAQTNASGVASFAFASAFTSSPDVEVMTMWAGDQMVSGAAQNVTLNGCEVAAKVSKGTLAVSAGPFQAAGIGVSVTIRAMGS